MEIIKQLEVIRYEPCAKLAEGIVTEAKLTDRQVRRTGTPESAVEV